jgi:hypothetical protein
VLHHATELAGVAVTGPMPPYVSELTADQVRQIAPVARALADFDAAAEHDARNHAKRDQPSNRSLFDAIESPGV